MCWIKTPDLSNSSNIFVFLRGSNEYQSFLTSLTLTRYKKVLLTKSEFMTNPDFFLTRGNPAISQRYLYETPTQAEDIIEGTPTKAQCCQASN